MRNNQRGFTLIEVLISILVFSIGLLGFATLQKRGQIAEMEAYQRVHALNYANFIASQMRANPDAIDCYDKDNLGTIDGSAAAPADCVVAAGEAVIQADEDIEAIHTLLNGGGETLNGANVGGLIDAKACVTKTEDAVNDYNIYEVRIEWQGQSTNNTAAANLPLLCDNSTDATRRVFSYNVTLGDLSE